MRRAASFVALALALLIIPARANAYVRSRIGNGGLVKFWAQSCIPVTIYLNKFKLDQYPASQPQMSVDAVVKSLTAAAHAWSPDLVTCPDGSASTQPYLEIVPTFAPVDATPPAAANDSKNVVIFRTDNWTKSGLGKVPYASEAVAITTVFSSPNGKILDADIEINAANVQWIWINLDPGVIPPSTGQTNEEIFDLQNSITHEFGHLLGLEHTCFQPISMGGNIAEDGSLRPQDDQGVPVPDCDNPTSKAERAVMFFSTEGSDTSKRVLSPDEVRFLCDIYPASKDPQMCIADEPNTGCATATPAGRRGHARLSLLGLLAVGGLVFATAWRRARARRLSARARARA